MKNLIIQALNDAILALDKRVPLTKKDTVYVNIEDVKPQDLISFMKKNNIPEDAYFNGKPNSYDAFDEVCLSYEIDIPTTNKEKLEFKRRVFSTIAHQKLYNLLITNGYKKLSYNSGLLKEFGDTTVYDMFINKDFDRLVKYYSLSFVTV